MTEDPLVGRHLANYRIERVLGRGGMAVVYYATDIRLRRPAAVKVIDTRFRGDSGYAERFIQEARAVASLHHENILQIYYAGDDDGLFYFAMEYIDGQNLGEILEELAAGSEEPARRFLAYEDVLRYGKAIASALDTAHAHGIIHRDVKPSNVLVANDGRIVLGDFGLAMNTRMGSFGEVFGSAQYMSPEQARRSNAAVPQSDLYSLGVILYEMLTGQLPFDDPSPTSLAIQHLTQPVPDPRVHRPELNEGVSAVLLRMLAKQPEERYPTGLAMMLNLEDALIRMVPSLPTVRTQNERSTSAARAGIPAGPSITLPGWEPGSINQTGTGAEGRFNAMQQSSSPAATQTFGATSIPKPPIREKAGQIPLPLMFAGLGVVGLIVLVAVVMVLGNRPKQGSAGVPPTLTAEAAAGLPPSTAIKPTATLQVRQPSTPANKPIGTNTQTKPAPPATKAAQNNPTKASPTKAVPTLTKPAPKPSPSWTPKYATGRRMVMFWNDSSFYILQASGYGELIEPLVFERVDAQGLATNRFSSRLWAEYTPNSIRDWCYRLLIGGPKDPPGGLAYLEPPQCNRLYAATRYPDSTDTGIFWTKQEGSSFFRVLWGREELQRCQISKGTCEVYIP